MFRLVQRSIIAALLCIGCGPVGIANSGTGDTGESSDTGEACDEGFEPAPDYEGVAVQYAFDPACVDVVSTHVIELPVAELHGVVTTADPEQGNYVSLRSQADGGTLGLAIADDGSYTTPVLPGTYDVLATIGVTTVKIDEVTIAGSTALDIAVPAPHQFSGRVTAEGTSFDGPAGIYLVWDEGTARIEAPWPTLAGSLEWDVAVAPGSYALEYRSCIGPLESGGQCNDFSFHPNCEAGSQTVLDYPTFVIDPAVEIDADLHLESVLPTVRFHGHLNVVGGMSNNWNGLPCAPVLNLWGPLPNQGVSVSVDEAGNFDALVFIGDYDIHVGTTSGAIEHLSLHEDVDLELEVETFELDATLVPSVAPLGSWPNEHEFYLRRADDAGVLPLSAIGVDECPATSFGRAFPGTYELVMQGMQLGPTYALAQQAATIEAVVPLARVGAMIEGADQWSIRLHPSDASTLTPGELVVLAPGSYELFLNWSGAFLGTAELTDGSAIALDLSPRELEISVLVDGQVVDGFDTWIERRRSTHSDELLLPGTYDVFYYWSGDAPTLPQNRNARIGCINLLPN